MSTIFDLKLTVRPEHIDVLGHVNNVVYVSWMQDVASAHIEALGLGIEQYLALKHAMVAVEHHVQYRKAALEGEELILRTWLNDINALYSFRQYAFFKPSDQTLLFTGMTKWACVEIATGRPKRMSPTFIQAYQPISAQLNPYDFSTLYLADECMGAKCHKLLWFFHIFQADELNYYEYFEKTICYNRAQFVKQLFAMCLNFMHSAIYCSR